MQLLTPGYRARARRAFVIAMEAFDWNCPQHIPQRFEADDVQAALAERDARIAALEARIALSAWRSASFHGHSMPCQFAGRSVLCWAVPAEGGGDRLALDF